MRRSQKLAVCFYTVFNTLGTPNKAAPRRCRLEHADIYKQWRLHSLTRLVAFVVAICWIVAVCPAAIAQNNFVGFVQGNWATPQSPATQTSVTVTFTSPQTAGNLNLVIVSWGDATAAVQSVTDAKGNTYSLAVGPTVFPDCLTQSIYYAKNIPAAAANANTVTVTFNTPAAYPDIRIAEYAGVDPNNPIDVVVGAYGSSSTSNSGSLTTTHANDLLVASNTTVGSSVGPGGVYIERMITDDGGILEDQPAPAIGTYNATAALDWGPQNWVMQLVALRLLSSISFVQGNFADPQTPESSVPVKYTAAQTAGNLNVVVVGWNDSTSIVQSVTDTQGNTYDLAIGPTVQADYATQSIYYAKNIAAAAANANTVTVAFNTPASYPDIRIAEYTAIDIANPLDVAVAAQGSGTTCDSGYVTTTNAIDLLIGANLTGSYTAGPGVDYANRMISETDSDILEDRLVAAFGSYHADAPLGQSGTCIMQMVAFRAAGSPNIASLSPTTGPVGTSVTITGSNFGSSQGSSTVSFNGTTASPCQTCWSATSITVSVPANATTGNVVVTVAGVASNGVNFTVQGNQPPTVSAGSNQTIELPVNTATLNGSASSTAPPGSPVTVQWTQVSGPGTVTFANPTQPVTQATFPGVGTYVLQLSATVTATGLSNSAQTTVTVAPVNQPPVVTVGSDQTIAYPTNTANLTGTVTDDGYPVGSSLQISWKLLAGPGSVSFANPSAPNTQATFSAPGIYVLGLSASDGQYTSSADMRVTYSGTSGGITVSAGPDQVIVYPTAASLSGSASDSNSALAGSLTTSWSAISGPGSVTFAQVSSPVTTATFSAPGVYDLRLTATDGVFTSTSDLKIYIGQVQCTLSNNSTDFWLMFIGAEVSHPTTTPPRQLSLFISSSVATSGTVSVPGQGLNFPFTTTPSQITTVNLPQSVQVTTSDTVEAKGIHVTAQNPIAVYGLNYVAAASDGYLGLPTNTLGTSYVIASYRNTEGGGTFQNFGTEFGITAAQDNTNVTIVPTTSSGPKSLNNPFGTHVAQQPFTIQLNQGQTYQLRNDTDYTEASTSSDLSVDFTGTIVTSDKPIAVFGGHDCTFVPDQQGFCNHLVEQMPPTNLWGENFVAMQLSQEANGDTYRIIAQSANTHVQVNHKQVATLQGGQFHEQIVQGGAEISADHPVLVMEYADGAAFSQVPGQLADPSMIVVPPFEQFGGNYTINTPTSNFQINFINVIAPTSAAQSSNVMLDGAAISPASFQPIGTSPFSGAQIQVSVGAHTLSTGLPFQVIPYGFDVEDAYGYTGGVCLANGVIGSTLTASPKTITNQITGQVCIQATVVDSNGHPIGGAGVTFTLAGINPQTGFATTNSNGVATFCYTSLRTGSDLFTITSAGASDTASVTWVSNGPNQPPVVTAGPSLSISLPTNTVFLNGSVIDDGLPVGGTLTSTWTKLSGPAAVSFNTPNQPQTSATFSQAGTYVLQLTGNDSQLSTSATTTVIVYPPNRPPVVSAGPNQSLIWVQNFNQTLTLNGTATDDGLPAGSTLTVGWNLVSGPEQVTFHSPNSASTPVIFNAPGTYVLQLSANDTQFTTTSEVTVNAYGPATVNFGSNLQAFVNTPITVSPTVLVGGIPPTSAMPLSLQWSVSAQPSGSTVTFGSPTAATTTANFDTAGTYQLALRTADSNTTLGSGNCCVTVAVAPANAQPPTVSIASPTDGTQITAPTTVTGTVSSGTWTLSYALQDDFNPLTFTTIATGTAAVSNGTLGTLDPTVLLNGTYVLQLTSVNSTGLFATASITVSVARNMKVGVFSLAFNDLTVPVAGIPIQVVRSYDSRDKQQGDFGIGWRLSLANIRLQKSHNLAMNWQETQTTVGFLPEFCIFPTDNKVVTVTFPDGRVFTFQAGNNPQCQLAGSITNAQLAFTELPGPPGTAGATLTAADGGQSFVDGNIPGPADLIGPDGNPYNPTVFVLQTADGTKYTIDQQRGLTAVTDPNGNTLTITANGITSSAGKSVPFGRDQQGRITQITDPAGNTLLYSYDSNGDLGSFTDRNKNATTYIYIVQNNVSTHQLQQAILRNGTNALTNAYDPSGSGRLTGTTDANGFTIGFSNNVAAQTQTITDRNGNSTTYAYDSDGNITQVTDALGHITTSTYDANDNKISETNGLGPGHTSTYTYDSNGNRLTETDPLNHTTTYTYNALNKPLTIKDANGNTTTNTYDANGNLLTTTDALGKITTNTYSAAGLLATTKDPLGNVTTFSYDGSGNLTTQKDALGTVTTYTYDGNNNRTSQSVTRTLPGGAQQALVTSYAYDGNGHVIKTTYPDLSTSQTVYNSIGQQITTIDALNRQTTYQYDADGHLTLTTYPDGSTDSSSYDHNGNRTQFIDRRGVSTTSVYDALNRVTQTKNASTQVLSTTVYDAIGEVLSTKDANNNLTQYAYDAAGRRTTVTDALSHVTTFGYDAAGNQTSVKDANNNTTSYTYDNDNRRTQVTYPDNKFETTTYDALGRVTARTDANSKVTQYNYDGLGRLTSVVQDAVTGGLNLLTQYAYDEVGNRITQTDANSHSTSYAYDQRGRRIQRKLPLGQSESYGYDAAGNLLTHTDFNSKTTTFTYDSANRLLSKTPDSSFNASPVTLTYFATGLRHTMTDPSGTTTYVQYDDRARLTQVTKPAGSLQYTYDLQGNLTRLSAQNNVTYTYDALNRLATAAFPNSQNVAQTSTYAYDNVGNLQSVTYPNSVAHSYTYDTRNRLTNMAVNKSATALASYAYTLDAAGHRLSVSELSGRTVNYGYDSLYRLTSETIASDPNSINGAVNYTYDSVGNRKQITSTLAPVPAGLFNYDANDRFTAGDTYDNDGNTVSSGGIANVYDFENHLVQKGGVTIVYDGDGNRVSKTVAGVTTTYLVDNLNPTGYAQVVYETFSGSSAPNRELNHVYVYGLELLGQTRNYVASSQSNTQQIYYDYDGHGSVRALTDPNGNITDTYDYDAFGNLIHSTGSTPNNYLFAGEQFDADLNLYYNRARYLSVSTGRFWTMDSYEGNDEAPVSLQKYLYVAGDPTNNSDPLGNQINDLTAAQAISVTADTAPTINLVQTLYGVRSALTVAAGLGAKVLSDPEVIEEVEGTGEAGIQIVQRSFVQLETVLSEAEAEETSIAENGSRAREILNQLYTKFPSPNPGDIEYHHIVEQGGVNASRFGRALQSFGNIIPLPEDVHQLISSFYSSSSQVWLSNGMRVRDWMASQNWETQWAAGLEIAKEAFLTGKITWHP